MFRKKVWLIWACLLFGSNSLYASSNENFYEDLDQHQADLRSFFEPVYYGKKICIKQLYSNFTNNRNEENSKKLFLRLKNIQIELFKNYMQDLPDLSKESMLGENSENPPAYTEKDTCILRDHLSLQNIYKQENWDRLKTLLDSQMLYSENQIVVLKEKYPHFFSGKFIEQTLSYGEEQRKFLSLWEADFFAKRGVSFLEILKTHEKLWNDLSPVRMKLAIDSSQLHYRVSYKKSSSWLPWKKTNMIHLNLNIDRPPSDITGEIEYLVYPASEYFKTPAQGWSKCKRYSIYQKCSARVSVPSASFSSGGMLCAFRGKTDKQKCVIFAFLYIK